MDTDTAPSLYSCSVGADDSVSCDDWVKQARYEIGDLVDQAVADKYYAGHISKPDYRVGRLVAEILATKDAQILIRQLVKEPAMDTDQPDPIMRFFVCPADLAPDLAVVLGPLCDLAHHLAATLPRNAERSVALRKLLEAGDSAVRAVLIPSTVDGPRSPLRVA